MKDTIITTAMNYQALGETVATSAKPTNDLQYVVFMVAVVVMVIAGLAIYMYIRDRKQMKTNDSQKQAQSDKNKCDSCSEINSIRPLIAQILANQEESKIEKRDTRKEIAGLRGDIKGVHERIDEHVQWHLGQHAHVSHIGG